MLPPLAGARSPREARLLSPLTLIGAFSLSGERLAALLAALRTRLDDAHALFSDVDGARGVALAPHFERLADLLTRLAGAPGLDEREREAAGVLLARLRAPRCVVERAPAAALADAAGLFMGGELEAEEDAPPSRRSTRVAHVRSLSEVEALTLTSPDATILFAPADDERFPGPAPRCEWPFSRAGLEALKETGALPADAAARLDDHLYALGAHVARCRFIFHTLASMRGLTLAREAERNGRPLRACAFALTHPRGLVETQRGGLLTPERVAPAKRAPELDETRLFTLLQARLLRPGAPVETALALENCPAGPWQLLYDYVLGPGPVVRGAFLTAFQLTQLIAFRAVLGRGRKEKADVSLAAREVFALYPGVSPAKRRQAVDFAYGLVKRWGDDELVHGRDEFGPLARLLWRYPPSDRAITLYRRHRLHPLQGFPDLKACTYCPHAAYCFARARLPFKTSP